MYEACNTNVFSLFSLLPGTASAYTQFDAAQKQLEEGWAEYLSLIHI